METLGRFPTASTFDIDRLQSHNRLGIPDRPSSIFLIAAASGISITSSTSSRSSCCLPCVNPVAL